MASHDFCMRDDCAKCKLNSAICGTRSEIHRLQEARQVLSELSASRHAYAVSMELETKIDELERRLHTLRLQKADKR